MSILFRYLALQILASVGLVLLGLTLLFSFFDLISELNDVHPSGYTASVAFLFVLIRLPARVHELLPIAALVGSLLALARLAISSEFTVMRASGLSVTRLAAYQGVLGLVLALMTLAVGEWLVPASEHVAQQMKLRGTAQIVAQEFRSGLWAKDGRDFINIRQVLPDASLKGLRIYTFDDGHRLQAVLAAERGQWSSAGHWILQGVVDTRIEVAGTRVSRSAERIWRSAVNPDLLTVLMINPDKMALSGLKAYIDYLQENGLKSDRYEVAFWSKLAFPVAIPVMLWLALPFAYQPPRGRGVGGRVLVGIFIGLGFPLANRLSGHIGMLNAWPPVASAVIPLLVFSLAAVIALWRAERR